MLGEHVPAVMEAKIMLHASFGREFYFSLYNFHQHGNLLDISFKKSRFRLQHDFSFHHRTDWVNNTLSYGSGYASAFIEWASNVADTKFRFSEQAVRLLIDYYLDGICKQMILSNSACL